MSSRRPYEARSPNTSLSSASLSMGYTPCGLMTLTTKSIIFSAIQQDGKSGRPLLFLTVEDARLSRVEDFANRTTQAKPVINAEQLALTDGRPSGVFQVQYRVDEWARPLTEQGYTAAAEYEIDAELARSSKSGSHKGLFGVRWTRTAPFDALK